MQHAREVRPSGHGAERRGVLFRNRFQRAVQPAVFGRLQAWRARFHEVLRVEMRARRVGRTGGVHDRELVLVKERLKWREARMQTEKSSHVHPPITIQPALSMSKPPPSPPT